jgi:Holliday junction resolvasome RuvABC ATP-dependent DNA helicase subunit
MPPLLLIGGSGLGKSLAVKVLAEKRRTNVLQFYGRAKVGDIAAKAKDAKHGDFIFFDECHLFEKDTATQELLYAMIDANKKGITDKVAVVEVPAMPGIGLAEGFKFQPLTFALATDQPAKLQKALKSRIQEQIRFFPYQFKEMREIVQRVAEKHNTLLTLQATTTLAKACLGMPRNADAFVDGLLLYHKGPKNPDRGFSQAEVREYLQARGIDAEGINEDQRRYMKFLSRQKEASLADLAAHLHADGDIRWEVEHALVERGWVSKGQWGRRLTDAGVAYLQRRGKKIKLGKSGRAP